MIKKGADWRLFSSVATSYLDVITADCFALQHELER